MEIRQFTTVRSSKHNIVDQPIVKPENNINLSTFSLLFCELVEYSQSKATSIEELQTRLANAGAHIGTRIVDLIINRDRKYKRETRLLKILVFIQKNFWLALFNKELDKLEQANDDNSVFYLIEAEPITNKFVSVPRDKGNFNCAAFIAGIIEAALDRCCFPCKVSVHWHEGTTFKIKFDESVMKRERLKNLK